MADWPDIANPSALTERKKKEQDRSDFEAGYVYTRAKWTRSRKIFELTWGAMKDPDKQTLEDFFDNNLGGTFTWEHPLSGEVHTVMFAEDELPAKHVPVNRWRVDLTLEEQ